MKINSTCVYLGFITTSVIGITTNVLALATVTIQPIQVCDDGGNNCANQSFKLFEAETDKIWNQAGIDISFLPFNQFNSTNFLVLDDTTEVVNLFITPGHQQNPNSLILNMWFVNTIIDANTFGIAFESDNDSLMFRNGIAIADITFSFNGGIGRLDTIAHEIGHNLGIGHSNFGAGGANNLMTTGASRSVPSSINDIYPDGLQLDQLTTTQINQVNKSIFVQPDAIPFEFNPSLGLIILGCFVTFKSFIKNENNRRN